MKEPSFYLGKSVTSLQTMLRQISEADARILPLIPNGFYGKSTHASVRSFQQAYGLPETGEADPMTWRTLAEVHSRILPGRFPPVIRLMWTPETVLQAGIANNHIYLVQAMLTVLSKILPDIPAPEFSGSLDTNTTLGLQQIQIASGLPVTGNLDTVTWHHLTGLYQTLAGDGIPDKKQALPRQRL